MRLATYAVGQSGASRCGVVVDTGVIDIASRLGPEFADLKTILASGSVEEVARRIDGAAPPDFGFKEIAWRPVIENPGMIACIGLNYEEHRLETERERTEHPAVFFRLPRSQVGHGAPLVLPRESKKFDYEGEIAVIIGKPGRRIPPAKAYDYIAGYSIYNDGSIRDWQTATSQWSAGKNFVGTGAFGPWLVTADEIPTGTVLTLETRLNGHVVQHSSTDMLIHSIPSLIAHISTFTGIEAGDVVVTGTPGGVGARRTPPLFIAEGDLVEVEVATIGILSNRVEAERL